jgi:hypothetical protein
VLFSNIFFSFFFNLQWELKCSGFRTKVRRCHVQRLNSWWSGIFQRYCCESEIELYSRSESLLILKFYNVSIMLSGLFEYFAQPAVAIERGFVSLLPDFVVRFLRFPAVSWWSWRGRWLRKGEDVLEDGGGEHDHDGASVPRQNIKYDAVVFMMRIMKFISR